MTTTTSAVRLVLMLGVGMLGCLNLPPVPNPPPAGLEPSPQQESAPAVPPPGCDEVGAVLLSVEPSRVSLACKGSHHECSGRATLCVHSCAARAIEFDGVVLSPAPPLRPPIVSAERTVRLEPGQTWTMELELDHHGVYEIALPPLATVAGDPPLDPRAATLTVDNPAREQAIVACRECNGDWGGHGIFGLEGCNCRTRDGGTPCDDRADCEGLCVERVQGSGFRCAEFTTMWGCYSYLPEGWSKQPRRRGESVAPPYQCVD